MTDLLPNGFVITVFKCVVDSYKDLIGTEDSSNPEYDYLFILGDTCE